MAKAVVYSLLIIFFFLFLVFSPRDQRSSVLNHGVIARRLGQKPHFPAFDPLIMKIERLAQEKTQPAGSPGITVDPNLNDMDDDAVLNELDTKDTYEDYFMGEGDLNTTMRLRVLFPLLDTAPKDGSVSLKELQTWMIQQTEENLAYRTAEELRLRDKDRDGEVSFREYLPQFSKEDIEKNEMEHGGAGWWKQQFVNADLDHSGSLDLQEFNNFLHPEDGKNRETQKWVLQERIIGMDYNGDGKLDYKEFLEHAYEMYKGFAAFETGGGYVASPQLLFAELDRNKDRVLAADELRPILPYLQPGELSYANYYSSFLLRQADDDNDGRLSLDEMLNHEDVFYKAVLSQQDMDASPASFDDYHDEL